MPYELECGHCGFQFVLDAWPLPRSVQCSVCGGRLTLAVPLARPTAPPESPKPRPLPKPPKPKPPAPPPAEEEGGAEPEGRPPRRLAAPWPVARDALNVARTAVEIGGVLYGLAMAFDLFVCPFVSRLNGTRNTDRMLTATLIAFLIPVLLHVGVACSAAHLPPAYGGRRARASAGLLVLAMLAAWAVRAATGARGLPPTTVVGLTTSTALLGAGAAFALWLTVLVRLGGCVGSAALADRARAMRTWLPFWVVLAASFLTLSLGGDFAKAPPIAWAGRALLAGTVLAALWHYAALLAFAVRVIDRRAPAAP